MLSINEFHQRLDVPLSVDIFCQIIPFEYSFKYFDEIGKDLFDSFFSFLFFNKTVLRPKGMIQEDISINPFLIELNRIEDLFFFNKIVESRFVSAFANKNSCQMFQNLEVVVY